MSINSKETEKVHEKMEIAKVLIVKISSACGSQIKTDFSAERQARFPDGNNGENFRTKIREFFLKVSRQKRF